MLRCSIFLFLFCCCVLLLLLFVCLRKEKCLGNLLKRVADECGTSGVEKNETGCAQKKNNNNNERLHANSWSRSREESAENTNWPLIFPLWPFEGSGRTLLGHLLCAPASGLFQRRKCEYLPISIMPLSALNNNNCWTSEIVPDFVRKEGGWRGWRKSNIESNRSNG